MKTIAYLDCPSGLSGDMCLGAVLDAGMPLDYVQTQLDRLGLGDEFKLSATSVLRQGLRALKANVEIQGPTPDAWEHDPPTSEAKEQAHDRQTHGHPAHKHQPRRADNRRRHGYRHDGASPPAADDHPSGSHHHVHTNSHHHVQTDGHSTVSTSAHSTTRIIHNGDVEVHHHQAHHHSHTSPAGHHPPTPDAESGHHDHPQGTRHLPEIEALITQAGLPERACRWSLAVFRQLAEAEAAVHGIAIDQVHFHEVGATDALVDIVGTCLGLDYLGIDALYCSALPTGQGRVKAAHGWLPVPAPAVLKLMEMRQIPLYSNGLVGELVTPTGAALVAALAQGFGNPPAMALQRVGLGAGQKDFPQANILRLWVGTEAASETPPHTETIAVLETQVDDMVPQAMGYLYDRLFEAGALDVFAQPIAMKKSRPGLLITVLCPPEAEARCTEVLFAETPTLGIRHRHQSRTLLRREFHRLDTPYGPVSMKVAYHPQTQAVLNVHPEYEDCAALARQHDVPWQVVYHTALGQWYQGGNGVS